MNEDLKERLAHWWKGMRRKVQIQNALRLIFIHDNPNKEWIEEENRRQGFSQKKN